jgi:hypothetical protein
MSNTFTGQEFAKRLSEGKLKESIVKIGMTKRHDDSSDSILFAEGGCQDWISIPVDVIEQVTFLQTVPCRDHRHPLVMIQFKEPPPGDKAATVFAELARRNAYTSARQTPPVMPGQPMQMMPGLLGQPPQTMPGAPGQPPQTMLRPASGATGGGFGHGGTLQCIVWHQVCGWTTLYISALNLNIPWYYCWDVCDIWGIP